MRIGLFTDTYPPYINGVSTSVCMLKHALEKKGHQVFVVTVNNNSLKYSFEDDNTVIRIPGIPVGIYDYRLTGVYPLRAINIVKKWKLDVIHSHTEFGIGTFARIIAKQLDIPLVHTYHTMYEDYVHYITHGYFNKSSKKIVEYLTLFYCDKTANELIVPTKKTYDLFKEKYDVDRNVHIIPTGIEIERFYKENVDHKKVNELKKQLMLLKDDFVIVFVGRIAEEKNIVFLIEAQREIAKKHDNIKLIIIGDGPDSDKYKQLVKKYKLDESVVFTGKVPWEQVPCYYQLADVFATASTTETQGLTVIEAMAGGVAPLCIDDESFRNVVIDNLNGRIFKTKKDYIKDVFELYKDSSKLDSLSKQARINAERHSSKYYAEGVLDVYEQAIGGKPKPKGIFKWFANFRRK
mgnify:FL=1